MSEYRFSLLQSLVTVGMNLLLLGSLFVGMYRATHAAPDDFVLTFFKTVLVLVPLSLVVGLGCRRLLNRHRPPETSEVP